ncbi:MAG: methyltransferase domain-containing protein [Gaiellales bacterium]
MARCGLCPGTPTLEIGPGGGQATADLLNRGSDPLIAVEPDPELAAYLASRFPQVDVRNVGFEEFETESASMRLVACATAWHWVEQSVGLEKLARFLEPGGSCALWWTVYHDPAVTDDPLYQALEPILERVPLHGPNTIATTANFAFDRATRMADLHGPFADVAVEEFHWSLELTPESACSLFATFSPILARPQPEREAILEEIAAVVRTQFGGFAPRPCVTILYTGQRV